MFKILKENQRIIICIFNIKIKIRTRLTPKTFNKYKKLFAFIDTFIPKRSNRIIFCSWPDYSDNSKFLFEYLLKYHTDEYDLIWAYRADNVPKGLENFSGKIVYHFSFKCLYYTWTSKFLCMTHDDFFYYNHKKHTLLELFHGMPIKSVGFAEKNITDIRLQNYSKIGENAHLFAI